MGVSLRSASRFAARLAFGAAALIFACALAQPAARDPPGTFAKAVARGQRATVSIYAVAQPGSSACVPASEAALAFADGGPAQLEVNIGAGFVFDDAGHVVTAAHVVAGCLKVAVELPDRRVLEATKVGEDLGADLALLRLPVSPPAPLLARRGALRAGDWVVAIGHPFGLARSASVGVVGATDRHFADEGDLLFIQTDIPLAVGYSGGPLLDVHGAVVGMNVRSIVTGQAVPVASLALPIDTLSKIVARLRRGRIEARPHLGADFDDPLPPIALLLGRHRADGALVTRVRPASLAERFGLKSGDIIVGMNGRVIAGSVDLARALAAWRDPDATRLLVFRDGRYRELVLDDGVTAPEPGRR